MENANATADALVKILPFERDFHLAPIRDITPDAIKEAATLARTKYRDNAELKHNTALNYITRRLGFEEGFAGYQKEGFGHLREFMAKHGLKERADLVRPRSHLEFVELTPRNLSDRLFSMGGNLPGRVFTGYNVDWFELNDRYHRHNPWASQPDLVNFTLPHEVVMREMRLAENAAAESGDVVLEAAVAACQFSISAVANLLGDVLFEYGETGKANLLVVPKLYRPEPLSAAGFEREEKRYREVALIFREWLSRREEGWVRVLRYNDALVFLKGMNGEYDFLFPGMRDELFNHNPHAPYLKNANVPKSNDAYHFKRWLYFEFRGWLEEAQHHCEITYYAMQGEPAQHPGKDALLKKHLRLKGEYKPLRKTAAPTEGYMPVRIGDRWLHVSNLVTMGDFRSFMGQNPDYAHYSRAMGDVDPWEHPNSAPDQSLPAVVTWYDANAYAAWISRTQGLPVRLLTEEEFLLVSSLSPGSRNDLQFLSDLDFGEWLDEEAAAINTATRESLCCPGFKATKARFCARSNGSYKSKQVGFRLCYLGEGRDNETSTSASK